MKRRGVLMLLVGWASVAAAHPFAISLAEFEFNREEKVVEVSLRVYPEQLEQALTLAAGKKISLERTEDIDSRIARYISERLSLGAPSTDVKVAAPTPIKWIGKEASAKEVWIYFEIPLDGPLAGQQIRNSLLFEVNKEQVNIVNLKDGERIATCVTIRSRPTAPIQWRKRRAGSGLGGGLEF